MDLMSPFIQRALPRGLFLSLLLLSCQPTSPPEQIPLRGVSERGLFEVEVSINPSPIPLNQPFELDVLVTAEGAPPAPEESWTVRVEGWMPGHGHGMLRQAEVDDFGDGRFRVRGMLFHMPGEWELRVLVIETRIEEEFRIVENDKVSLKVSL